MDEVEAPPLPDPALADIEERSATQISMDMETPADQLRHSADGWQLPPTTVLAEVPRGHARAVDNERRAVLIVDTLASFGVDSAVVQINEGPTVTQFGVEPGWDVKTRLVTERDATGRAILNTDGHPRQREVEVSRTRIRVNRITALQNDLALALAADKQHQRAVDLLRQVVEGKWNGRFPEIELIALNEMNAIIVTCGKELEAGNLDKRLLKNLPVDVRVILTWDADNTDMDLWVTDPNGEKCFYSHRNTKIGGHMSPDYTGGYGPEEFLLKRAQPGKYLVHVNYYGNRQQVIAGATTVQLEMTTDFGKPIAKTESVTLRLQGSKEVIKVGEFVIPGKKDKQQAVSKEKK